MKITDTKFGMYCLGLLGIVLNCLVFLGLIKVLSGNARCNQISLGIVCYCQELPQLKKRKPWLELFSS